jgi:Putative prokaryotic signal transducing protein
MGGKSKLVSVYSGNYLQAQIVKGRLESEGVPAMLRYEGAGLIYGITVDGLGEARVMVPEDLAAEAEAIVADHEYGEPEDMTDDEPSEQS